MFKFKNIIQKSLSSSLINTISFKASKKLGFIGVGKMGLAMARNLAEGGHEMIIYDPSEEAMKVAQKEFGAIPVDSPKEVAKQTSVMFSLLPNDITVRDVIGNKETGLLQGMSKGDVHISVSTISPHTAREMAKDHKKIDTHYIGSPVFARPDGMAMKAAYFPVGGNQKVIKKVTPIIEKTATKVFNFGKDAGAGNVVKLCGNFLICAAIESMAESCALGEMNGIDRVKLIQMMNSTIFDCLIYQGYGQRVSERDHFPYENAHFSLEYGHKDVNLVQDTSNKANLTMPFNDILVERFESAVKKGRKDMDWSAIGLEALDE